MKTYLLISILFFPIQFLFSQSDLQWFIWENKYGANASAARDQQMLFPGTEFYINGVKHPGLPIPVTGGTSLKPRNDLFIIFENGDYLNTRYANQPGSTTLQPPTWAILKTNSAFPNSGYKLKSYHTPNTINKIQYLYYTNIYEDNDDPHIGVKLEQVGDLNFHEVLLEQFNQENTRLSANHDVVKGKDITLIVPSTIQCEVDPRKVSNFQIYYDTAVLIFDQVLLQQTDCSIEDERESKKVVISYNTHRNQFINFKTKHTPELDTVHENGDNVLFRMVQTCNDEIHEHIHEELIQDSHDPNFIRIDCISKRTTPKTFVSFNPKYTVRYHIEFYNDGLGEVDTCDVEFYLPSIANPDKIIVDNWRYGDTVGCGLKPGYLDLARDGRKIKFKFNTGNLDPVYSPMNSRKATIDFCVGLNTSDENSVKKIYNLRLDSARTYFDGTPYLITHFIDPRNSELNNIGRTTLRSECPCGCKTRNIINTNERIPVSR